MLILYFQIVVVGRGLHLAVGVELVVFADDRSRVLFYLKLRRLQPAIERRDIHLRPVPVIQILQSSASTIMRITLLNYRVAVVGWILDLGE